MNFSNLSDDHVTSELNEELIAHLQLCFPTDNFKFRYWREMPKHRFFIRDSNSNDKLVAHCAIHFRWNTAIDFQQPFSQLSTFSFLTAAVCEVSVHPDYRKRGMAKLLLEYVEEWVIQNRSASLPFDFLALFGKSEYYLSSGYLPVPNRVRELDFDLEVNVDNDKHEFKYKPLKANTSFPWPSKASIIDINGWQY